MHTFTEWLSLSKFKPIDRSDIEDEASNKDGDEMNNNDEAKAAMEALSGKELSGRTLVINEARARQ